MASIIYNNVFTRTLSRFALRIYLLTWNVNRKAPPEDMSELLQLEQTALPDIYCVGLQECSGYDWEGAFIYVLQRYNFVMVKSRKLQGIHTFLFVYRPLLCYVSHVESELTKTGFGGYWGNKGASSVRLDFMGVNIIVVNCHLAAHKDEVMARLEDIDTIMDSQKFRDIDTDNILDHDYVFWIGDLNFRLEDISRGRVLELIEQRDYQALLKHDQLNMVKEESLAFDNFEEGTINFPPTYKFDKGEDEYDTSPKQRIPAYTDRVLYFHHNTQYGKERLNADVFSYLDHPSYKASDHRPVSALITFSVPTRCIHSPVTFEIKHKRIYKGTDHKFVYKIRKDYSTSYDDWIGLYEADFPHFDCYLKFQWVTTGKTFAHKDRHGAVVFPESQLHKLEDGDYVLCYMTRKGSICGISHEFTLSSCL